MSGRSPDSGPVLGYEEAPWLPLLPALFPLSALSPLSPFPALLPPPPALPLLPAVSLTVTEPIIEIEACTSHTYG